MAMPEGLRRIENCQFGLPTTWSSIPNQPNPTDWPDQVADLLADEGRAHKRLTKALRAGHAAIIDPPGSHMVIGVWVPDRSKGEICGMVFADVLDGDPPEHPVPTREYYRSLVDPDHRTGITVFGRKLDELDLPAGPTLLAREIIGRPLGLGRKLVQHNVIYTVFPPGCTQALQITASTTDMPLGETLEIDLEQAMPSLTVSLHEPE